MRPIRGFLAEVAMPIALLIAFVVGMDVITDAQHVRVNGSSTASGGTLTNLIATAKGVIGDVAVDATATLFVKQAADNAQAFKVSSPSGLLFSVGGGSMSAGVYMETGSARFYSSTVASSNTSIQIDGPNGTLKANSGSTMGFTGSGDGTAAFDTRMSRLATGVVAVDNGTANTSGAIALGATTFASLGTPANGQFRYCSDCTIAATCAGSGTGALAKRLNAVWVCN